MHTGGASLQQAAVKLAVGKTPWISCPFMIYQMTATAVNCALPACTAFYFVEAASTVHTVVSRQSVSSHSACFSMPPGEISRYHGNPISRKCMLQLWITKPLMDTMVWITRSCCALAFGTPARQIAAKTLPMEGFKQIVPSRRSSRWYHRDDGLKPGKGAL